MGDTKPYKMLAAAVVARACEDYLLAKPRDIASLRKFFRSGWFIQLSQDLDGEHAIKQLDRMNRYANEYIRHCEDMQGEPLTARQYNAEKNFLNTVTVRTFIMANSNLTPKELAPYLREIRGLKKKSNFERHFCKLLRENNLRRYK